MTPTLIPSHGLLPNLKKGAKEIVEGKPNRKVFTYYLA